MLAGRAMVWVMAMTQIYARARGRQQLAGQLARALLGRDLFCCGEGEGEGESERREREVLLV